jgi:hypothetical protein
MPSIIRTPKVELADVDVKDLARDLAEMQAGPGMSSGFTGDPSVHR